MDKTKLQTGILQIEEEDRPRKIIKLIKNHLKDSKKKVITPDLQKDLEMIIDVYESCVNNHTPLEKMTSAMRTLRSMSVIIRDPRINKISKYKYIKILHKCYKTLIVIEKRMAEIENVATP